MEWSVMPDIWYGEIENWGNKKKAESGTRRKHSIATKLDNESGEY